MGSTNKPPLLYSDSAKVHALVPLDALLLGVVVHVCHPLCPVVDHNVGVRCFVVELVDGVKVSFGLDDVVNLGVGNVSRRQGAFAGLGQRVVTVTEVQAVRTVTAGLSHLEAATVAADADVDFMGGYASLGDHGERVDCFGDVDVGSQAVTALTPLSVKVRQYYLSRESVGTKGRVEDFTHVAYLFPASHCPGDGVSKLKELRALRSR
jgi:hypothetical protein